MPSIFPRSANLVMSVGLIVLASLVIAGVFFWWYWPQTSYRTHTHWAVVQPVPFSHQHHVSGLGIDCRFCHSTVEVSSNASLPPTYTCMTCHSQIWTNAKLLAPVRDSLSQDEPLHWQRVTDLPDYVYFNHGIHIAKGVGCSSCHGDVATMPLTFKARSLTMGFCLDCHRDPGPRLRPADQIFNTAWQRNAGTPSTASLLQQYHVADRKLTDCSICHR